MRRIFSQARKELTQLVRDRLALALALVLPLILLFLLSTAISLTVHNLPLVIQDLDDSSASRRLADAFRSSISFHVVSWPPDRKPEDALTANRARGVLIVPRNFGHDLARGANPQVQLLVDATDSNTARIVQGYVNQVTHAFNQSSGAMAGATLVGAQVRLWYNPGRDSPKFYSPGIFVMGISMFPALLAALAMAKEGEQKTILQVYVSSISAHEFLLGKILAYMVVAACEWILGHDHSVDRFRPAHRRRSDAVYGRQRPLCVLRVSFGTFVGAGIPEPGGRHSSRGAGRFSAGLSALRADLSGGEYSGGLALGFEHRVGPVLHRNRARRLVAGRRMAGHVVSGFDDRGAGRGILHAGVEDACAACR